MNEEYEIAEEMAKIMDEEEKKKQFIEIFPDEKLVRHNSDLTEAKKRLEAVFKAVSIDNLIDANKLNIMNESTRSALNALYEYVKLAPEHKTGLVFDVNIYLEAMKLYEKNFDEINRNQRLFWCNRVEEYLASLLSTSYLRPHAQGNWKNLNRNGCILADTSSYFAFRRTAHSIPGCHFSLAIDGTVLSEKVRGRLGSHTISTFMSSKNENGEKIRAAILSNHKPAFLNY